MRSLIAAGAVLACANMASAQVVNGDTIGDGYGARAVQTVDTQFGDNQSEMNAAYARISGGRLYLALTGNIQNNFNKLEIFIDSTAGGSNTYLAGNPSQDGGRVVNMNGLGFDTGFNPDYHLFVRRGNAGSDTFDLDYAIMGTSSFSSYVNLFGGSLTGSGSTGTGANGSPIQVAYNDSNVAGVGGGTGAANTAAALAVTTGLELSIDLADLGAPAGAFNVMVFQNNDGHNYASNQFLGGLAAGQGNLGGNGTGGFTGGTSFDLDDFAGNQYFSVPEPTTLSLLALGALAMFRRR